MLITLCVLYYYGNTRLASQFVLFYAELAV